MSQRPELSTDIAGQSARTSQVKFRLAKRLPQVKGLSFKLLKSLCVNIYITGRSDKVTCQRKSYYTTLSPLPPEQKVLYQTKDTVQLANASTDRDPSLCMHRIQCLISQHHRNSARGTCLQSQCLGVGGKEIRCSGSSLDIVNLRPTRYTSHPITHKKQEKEQVEEEQEEEEVMILGLHWPRSII